MMIIYTLLGLVVAAGSAFAGYYYATSLANIDLLDKDMVLKSIREYATNLEAANNELKANLTRANEEISALKSEIQIYSISAAKPAPKKSKKTPAKKVVKKNYKKSA